MSESIQYRFFRSESTGMLGFIYTQYFRRYTFSDHGSSTVAKTLAPPLNCLLTLYSWSKTIFQIASMNSHIILDFVHSSAYFEHNEKRVNILNIKSERSFVLYISGGKIELLLGKSWSIFQSIPLWSRPERLFFHLVLSLYIESLALTYK